MELEDFFYSYPPPTDPKFQTDISSRFEFNQLGLTRKGTLEPNPKTGNFDQQELIHRYMLNYDKIVLIWEAGMGKTWGSLGASEKYRKLKDYIENQKEINYVDLYFKKNHTYIRRCYIILKNTNLIKTFKKELYTKNLKPGEILDEKTEKKYKKIMKTFYTFLTYIGFYNLIKGMSVEKIKEKFDNTFIIIDEVQNIIPSDQKLVEPEVKETPKKGVKTSTPSKKETPKKGTPTKKGTPIKKGIPSKKETPTKKLTALALAQNPEQSFPPAQEKEKKAGVTKKEAYTHFYKLFHNISNAKIMFLSATLMFNKVSEVAYVINLLLPENNQMPTQESSYVKFVPNNPEPGAIIPPLTIDLQISPQKLNNYFRSIISYTKSSHIGIDVVYNNQPVYYPYEFPVSNEEYFKRNLIKNVEYAGSGDGEDEVVLLETNVLRLSQIVEKCYMVDDGPQKEAYLQEEDKLLNVEKKEKSEEKSQEKSGLYTNFKKISNFVFPDGTYKTISEKYVDKLEAAQYDFKFDFINKYIKTPKLKELSCKFDRVVNIIKEKREKKIPGIVYIFFELKVTGAYLLDAVLRAIFGYSRIKGKESLPLPPKNPKIAVLTGDTRNIQDILDVINEDKNYKGDYVEVIIATEAVGEGYSIKNVTTIIQMESTWNEARSYQAIHRGIRINSFEKLIRERGKTENLPENLPLDEIAFRLKNKIQVRVYKMATLPEQTLDLDNNPVNLDNSFDTNRYFVTEKKDWHIKSMERYLKRAAIDCYIHRERNLLPKEKDYTPDCDYQECVSGANASSDSPSIQTKYDTYNMLYSDIEKENIKLILSEKMAQNNIIPLNDVVIEIKMKKQIKNEIIKKVISELIQNNTIFLDRYGFPKYLYEDYGYLYLSDEYGIQGYEKYNNVAYSETLILKSSNSISEKIDTLTKKSALKEIKESDYETIKAEFNFKTIDEKSTLLENAIIEIGKDIDEKKNSLILEKLNGYYYKIVIPTRLISKVGIEMRKKRPGHQPITGYHDLTDKQWEKLKSEYLGEKIKNITFIHYVKMYNLKPASRGAGLYRFTGKETNDGNSNIRILEKEGWKTVTNPEQKTVYSNILNDNINDTLLNFEDSILKYFGSEKYGETKINSKLDPIYIVEHKLEPIEDHKIKIIIPQWFQYKFGKKGKEKKEVDRRNIPRGTQLSKLSADKLLTLLDYFGKSVKGINATYGKILYEEMKTLGLVLIWEDKNTKHQLKYDRIFAAE